MSRMQKHQLPAYKISCRRLSCPVLNICPYEYKPFSK